VNYLALFVLLQVLDLMTTMIGLRLGAGEANPWVVGLMRVHNPLVCLMVAKAAALGWGVLCLIRKKPLAIRIVNYMFAGLVMWNLFVILRVLRVAA
jgi:hypothetical protein